MSAFLNALMGGSSDKYNDVIVYDAAETIVGSAAGTYTDGSFTYASSIDSINNLYATYSYDIGFTGNMPIVCLGHGYGGDASTITYAQMHTYAAEGFFVLCIGMRGRNSASGLQDSSGREIYDLYDAIMYARANFSRTSQKKVAWSGFSGGGGNGLALRCKFPDLCNVTVSHYGMSDYGEDPSTGWYYTNPSYAATIASWVGATPAGNINKYKARNSRRAIGLNTKAGKLRIYHNSTDDSVAVIHSKKIGEAIVAAGKSALYTGTYSDTIYQHANYDSVTLADFKNEIKTLQSFNIEAGIFYVVGFLKTKLFEVWLGDGTDGIAKVKFSKSKNKIVVINELSTSQNITVKYNGVTKSDTLISQSVFLF